MYPGTNCVLYSPVHFRFAEQLLMLHPLILRAAENLNGIPKVADNRLGIVDRC
jgi:hypothetical protein